MRLHWTGTLHLDSPDDRGEILLLAAARQYLRIVCDALVACGVQASGILPKIWPNHARDLSALVGCR